MARQIDWGNKDTIKLEARRVDKDFFICDIEVNESGRKVVAKNVEMSAGIMGWLFDNTIHNDQTTVETCEK